MTSADASPESVAAERGDFERVGRGVFRKRTGPEIHNRRNPPWTRDEIILACELVMDNGWRSLTDNSARVQELSALLQTPAIFAFSERGPDFRNHAGVARKTADIATRHPHYQGKLTHGNRLDAEVLNEYLKDPVGMKAHAAAIREALADPHASVLRNIDVSHVTAEEGGILIRRHLHRERDPKLRDRKIASAKRRGIAIACEICGFEFERVYGERGRDYIECHHRTPLHVSGKTTTTLDDLALICANCHRMIHRTRDWLSPEQLKAIVAANR